MRPFIILTWVTLFIISSGCDPAGKSPSISPTSSTILIGGTQGFTVKGGTPPYSWTTTCGDNALSSFTGISSTLTGQTRGSCSVTVTDSKTPTPQQTAANVTVNSRYIYDYNGDGHITLVCLGDSNTMPYGPGAADSYRWCEGLRDDLAPYGVYVTNEAFMGMRVTEPSMWNGSNWGGPDQLAAALAGTNIYAGILPNFVSPFPPADVVIAAFGTNDVNNGRTNKDIIAAYSGLVNLAPGILVLIATTPPEYMPQEPQVIELNNMIRATFPAWQIIDFDTGFQDLSLYEPSPNGGYDPIHFNGAGERLREQRALTVITH